MVGAGGEVQQNELPSENQARTEPLVVGTGWKFMGRPEVGADSGRHVRTA